MFPPGAPGAMPSRRNRLLRQLFAGLLRDHVGGVPIWPVLIAMPEALLVLAVGGLRTPKRAGKIARRGEGCRCGVDAARQSRPDLLEEPAVPIRIAERGERAV